ncbi:MAG: aldehyde dehydrogenase [Acholeplasmataceae bacterium]|nr:aldehyde dehydrogenase [Acholeplasmataceae bacterium]
MNYQKVLDDQKVYYQAQKTKSYEFRIESLKLLKEAIITYDQEIKEALKSDLNKSEFESFLTEIGITILEINLVMKNLKKWMKPKRVKTPITLFHATSYIYQEPYGTVFIMSPWNYPFQLAISPLIGAIAAGNTVILKTSQDSPETSKVIKKMLSEIFSSELVSVFTGDLEESKALLKLKYDYIFFTGSTPVGRVVMSEASKNLIPVTLELGGKSPAIIDETVDLDLTAKRIAYGKFMNAGQTCIAPDYILIKEELKDSFVGFIKKHVESWFGENPLDHEDYPKIINEKNHTRLLSLIEDESVVFGGRFSIDKIEPTILNHITKNSKVMQEEIFGPILPLLTFSDEADLIEEMKQFEKPLALYLFTKNKSFEKKIIEELSFGGATINDTMMHFGNKNIPFGGIGASGMGSYHGYKSFETFSHAKGVVKRSTTVDLSFRYPPYTKKKLKLLNKIIK